MTRIKINVATSHEPDGRWAAVALELPGVVAYGATREEAIANIRALAEKVLGDRPPEDKPC